jgi:hypothetical protein
MALPGVVDPVTGATTANPLDPTNPASGQSLVPSPVPQPINLSQGVGLTGADSYNVQRLTRAQTYLSGALPNYPDLATAAALAPTDWTTLDQHIQALGGQVGYGAGVGQLMDTLMQTGQPKVPVADIGTLQQTMVKQGFLPPNTPITGTWDANSAAAFKAMEDASYNTAQQGQKAGGASALQFLSWLHDFMPSSVAQALEGTAKFLFGGIAHTVSRQAIEAAHAPGTYLATILNYNAADNPTQRLADNPEVQAALAQHGLAGGLKGNVEDLSTVLSLLPILRGAGVLQQGISAAGAQAAEQGLLTPAEGAISKGLIASSVRTLTAKAALADSPTAVGDLLNSYATRTFGLRSLGEGFLNTADQLAAAKSTALGQGITAGLNALTQTAIGERAVANVSSGQVLPNIKLGKMDRSTLGQAIDNTPVLGQNWTIPGTQSLPGPLRALIGNPLDLSAFIWAPTKALPIGGSPTIGDMANSLGRITPTDDLMPLIRATGMSREDLVNAFGSDAALKQGMRYFALQASINRDATLAVDAAGLKPGAEGYAAAVTQKAQDISANLKANPLQMEQAISSASPIDILHQVSYMFGDQPEVLARRGQGAAVLGNWADATTAIKDVTPADAMVNTFTRGQGLWTQANQDALNSALEPFMADKNIPPIRDANGNLLTPVRAGGGGVPGSTYAFGEQMAGRLGEALGPDATIALRRADNALGSAQQLASWKTLTDRLGSVTRSLDQRLAEAEPGATVEAPKLLQVGDLQAAGMTPQQIAGFQNPRLQGLTGAQIPLQQASDLLTHLNARLSELNSTMHKYYEETANMDPRTLSTYANGLAQRAARDVTLSDPQLMNTLQGLGYQPVALHPGAITLNHVGPVVADGLANAADVSPVKDFIGINKVRPEELAFMRTQATRNELDDLAKSGAVVGQNGKELMGRVYDTAQAAQDAGRNILGTNLQMERHVTDLRQLSVKDFQNYGGFSPSEAWQMYGAVRRGAAFGFDISRPIATAKNLVDALAYNGLPGIEDAIRTLVSLKPNTGVPFVDGVAGHILNLPDNLARLRDFVQFSMSPMFAAEKSFKTKILRGVESLPFDFRPADRIAELAADSGNADDFYARFNENYRNVMGESRGNAYATLLDNPDYGIRNPGSGVFGHTNEHGLALDAWRLAQQARQDQGVFGDTPLSSATYQAIHDKVQSIYGYGARSGLEKSANYVFFPLSFDIKVGKALGGWALQNPARILAISLGLQAYNQANANNAIGGFFDRYLPLLQEANKLNFFSGGFHTQLSPIGGRNTTLWNMGKDVNALFHDDPRLGAYVPISVSDNNLPNMLGLMGNLLPMWRQLQTGGKALSSQLHAVDEGGADAWQVDNYYQTANDLKKQVAIALGNAGLKPSFSTLTDTYGNMNPKISPEFFNQVQAALGQVEAKYPAGAAFAKAYSADYQTRSQALNELFRKPVKTRADASMLYFAAAYYDLQAQAQSSARANASTGRAGRALYQQIAGAMAQGTTPPTLPGDLDATQVAQLRNLALGLSQQAGPEFQRQYNLLFKSELGPLSAYEQAPGSAPTAA